MVDLVGIVESLYRFDLPDVDWLRGVGTRLAAIIDTDHQGHWAATFRCPDPTTFETTCEVDLGMAGDQRDAFYYGQGRLPPEYVADAVLNRSWSFGTDVIGWDSIPGVRSGLAASVGIADMLYVSAMGLDGRGCCFGAVQRERRRAAPALRVSLSRIGQHLKAVNGIRSRVQSGEALGDQASAVLDANGRLLHARGGLGHAAAEQLSRAARRTDGLRTRRRRSDAYRALEEWRAHVGDRWTLVDTFERDGRRYILAVEQPPAPAGPCALSERERQVIAHAQRGLSNKAIAYELGLAASTVRVLMTRAMAKVGVRSRDDLLRQLRDQET